MNFRLSLLLDIELFLELLNTPAAVDELLLSGKERMAGGTYVQSHFFLDRLALQRVAACTSHLADFIVWMNSLFHVVHLFSKDNIYLISY